MTWRPILDELYGQDAAAVTAPRVSDALTRFRRAEPVAAPPLSESDAWLITYPDQFQDGARSPLGVMGEFLDADTRRWITGVHVLPFYPWSSDDGFAVEDYCAVDDAYGQWSDVTALSHGRRLMVDAVINHMSSEAGWFRRFLDGDPRFAGYFRTVEPNADLSTTVRARTSPLVTSFESVDGAVDLWTTFSPDQVDLDYRNPNVLVSVLETLLEYVERGATVLRLDAVGFLWKEEGTPSVHLPQTHAIVQFLRACLDDVAPDTIIVTETNVPHAENISYLGDGSRREAQLVYQFPLAPLVLDAVVRGDASTLADWLSSLAAPIPGTSFLNFLASHDGIGVRPAEGLIPPDRVQSLADLAIEVGGGVNERTLADGSAVPYELNSTWFDLVAQGHSESEAIRRHLATHAVMIALAGVPLFYIHSLFGSGNDLEGFHETGRFRSFNRRRFDDVASLEAELATPSSRAARVNRGIREMMAMRAAHSVFHPASPQRVLDAPPQLVVVERGGGRDRALVAVNLSGEDVSFDLPGGDWTPVSGDETTGGQVLLSGWSSSWLRSEW